MMQPGTHAHEPKIAGASRPRRRWAWVLLVSLAVLLGAAAYVYAFGVPQATPSAAIPAPAATGAAPSDAEVPPPDPNSPLAIQIPGCVCHSDDPKVVAEHEQYRMNQCFGCHKDGGPKMGQ